MRAIDAPDNEILFEEVPCNLCGRKDHSIVLEDTLCKKTFSSLSRQVIPSDSTIETGRIVQCDGCRLHYVNPRPVEASLSLLYAQMEESPYLEEGPSKMWTAARLLKKICKFSSGRRLLDVGCHTGFFLLEAQKEGWEVMGVEPSEWASHFARETLQLPVVTGRLENFPPGKGPFDVITLFQVLEHVVDPKDFLKRAYTLLVPGGLIVIEVPDIESLAARLLKKRWWLLKATHLYYFSLTTLSMYLEQGGFEIVWQGTATNAFSLGHLAKRLSPYSPFLSHFLSKIFDILHVARRSIPLDLKDLLLVYAKKR